MGTRARIPSQKALMAKEAQGMKGNAHRGKIQMQTRGKQAELQPQLADSSAQLVESWDVADVRSIKQLMDAHNFEINNSSPIVEQLTTNEEELKGTVWKKSYEIGQCSKVPKKQKKIEATKFGMM